MIGLFFGDTDFPKKILNKIIKLKKNYFIIDLSKNRKFKSNKNSHSISIGQFGRIINLIKEKKCKKVISFNPELTLSKGTHTKLKPNKNDFISISKGIKSLTKLNSHNHVQGLVIRSSSIIAKETSKGTKNMLQLIKKSKNSKGILIKFPKKKQDLRVDLPTIGFDTLKDCKKAGIKGIILKSKQNIFLDKVKSINFANKNKMFIKIKWKEFSF